MEIALAVYYFGDFIPGYRATCIRPVQALRTSSVTGQRTKAAAEESRAISTFRCFQRDLTVVKSAVSFFLGKLFISFHVRRLSYSTANSRVSI
jgi:hypothetical protein